MCVRARGDDNAPGTRPCAFQTPENRERDKPERGSLHFVIPRAEISVKWRTWHGVVHSIGSLYELATYICFVRWYF